MFIGRTDPEAEAPILCQASLFMGFPRLEYWSGLPFPSPGALSDPGIEPRTPALQADSLPSEPPEKLRKAATQRMNQRFRCSCSPIEM